MNIIIDTREQQPWQFTQANINIVSRKLDTGDYTIEGFEDILCIERKKSVSELANNITKTRFHNEIVRMSKFRYPFLILEFDYDMIKDFPNNSRLPYKIKKKIRVKGPFILKKLDEIQNIYNINIVPCVDVYHAQDTAYSIMTRIKDEVLGVDN